MNRLPIPPIFAVLSTIHSLSRYSPFDGRTFKIQLCLCVLMKWGKVSLIYLHFSSFSIKKTKPGIVISSARLIKFLSTTSPYLRHRVHLRKSFGGQARSITHRKEYQKIKLQVLTTIVNAINKLPSGGVIANEVKQSHEIAVSLCSSQ